MSEEMKREVPLSISTDHHIRRTLRFVVSLAAETAFPGRTLAGGHAVGTGYLYGFDSAITKEDLAQLEAAYATLVASQAPIELQSIPFADAVAYFEAHRQPSAAALIKSRVSAQVSVNVCGEQMRLAMYSLFPTTSQLAAVPTSFRFSEGGFLVTYTGADYEPQPGIEAAMREHVHWGTHASGIQCVGELNTLERMPDEARRNMVLECELRQEQKMCEIAMAINQRGGKVRALCIAGPTSSGKTTFANKLAIYLRNFGFVAKALTVDHYYRSLPDQPKYKLRQLRSDVNYDHIESMDVELVNEHVSALMRGEPIMAPTYNMKSGLREGPGTRFELPANGIVVMEGIHALNPDYTKGVPAESVFRVYISPLQSLQVDDFNAVKTTHHRLLRRMCRDYLFRGHSVSKTLGMWDRVRVGEHAFIFPNQNNADYFMNSGMNYELCVLKSFLEPGLKKVPPTDPHFAVAAELLQTLEFVDCWSERDVPKASLLREFIGDGAFDEH